MTQKKFEYGEYNGFGVPQLRLTANNNSVRITLSDGRDIVDVDVNRNKVREIITWLQFALGDIDE